MPTDDEVLDANRALTRLARKLSTACGENDETMADVVSIRRGLGLSFERAPTLGEVFDPEREAAKKNATPGQDAAPSLLEGTARGSYPVSELRDILARMGDAIALGRLDGAAVHGMREDARAILRLVGAGEDVTIRLLSTCDAIDGTIADLAGAVREVASTLARHSNIGPDPEEAEKAHASKRAKRTRKRK